MRFEGQHSQDPGSGPWRTPDIRTPEKRLLISAYSRQYTVYIRLGRKSIFCETVHLPTLPMPSLRVTFAPRISLPVTEGTGLILDLSMVSTPCGIVGGRGADMRFFACTTQPSHTRHYWSLNVDFPLNLMYTVYCLQTTADGIHSGIPSDPGRCCPRVIAQESPSLHDMC